VGTIARCWVRWREEIQVSLMAWDGLRCLHLFGRFGAFSVILSGMVWHGMVWYGRIYIQGGVLGFDGCERERSEDDVYTL
jgi:hypothetical protein